jgi:hypothetical protein
MCAADYAGLRSTLLRFAGTPWGFRVINPDCSLKSATLEFLLLQKKANVDCRLSPRCRVDPMAWLSDTERQMAILSQRLPVLSAWSGLPKVAGRKINFRSFV